MLNHLYCQLDTNIKWNLLEILMLFQIYFSILNFQMIQWFYFICILPSDIQSSSLEILALFTLVSTASDLSIGSARNMFSSMSGERVLLTCNVIIMCYVARDNVRVVVEDKAKEMIKTQLNHFSIIDQISVILLNF